MATDDITAVFADIRTNMTNEGPLRAGQEGLVAAFEMLCIDMRRTADLLEGARGPEPNPQPVLRKAKE